MGDDACWVRVGRERSREGKVRKWRGEREKVDRVGEMTVIENDVVYFVLLLNSELFVNQDLRTCSPY